MEWMEWVGRSRAPKGKQPANQATQRDTTLINRRQGEAMLINECSRDGTLLIKRSNKCTLCRKTLLHSRLQCL
ncbi:hypothetical protein BaRGS_00028035 [Batillaria attramentaria]|uniref:Uncharacterized protein n=1 Tax=Batillaria attramentaria TaxID=370345 RepID=A0ABD0K041_9CAEN